MEFAFVARDALGHEHEGLLEAESQEEAAASLRRDGMQVLELEEDGGGLNLFPRRVSRTDVIYTTSQLAIMVDTGINLAQALAGLQEQEENPTLRRILGLMRRDVEAGENFSEALCKHPRYFDRTFVALVKSSEETGTLGEMLEQISEYLRKEMDTLRKVRSAMAYPGVMMLLSVGVTTFLLTYIMPKFTPVFARKGAELPKLTAFVMQVSDLMVDYWYFWLAGLLLLIGGAMFGPRTDPGRKFLDWMRIHIPVMGPLFRKVIISRSVRALGTMLRNGVGTLDAIRLTSEVSGNYYYEKCWLRVLEDVTNGRRISESLQGSPLFPKTLVQMIGSGEETARLDYVLEKVSGYYDREVESAVKTATTVIEPLMISVMGVVVGGIAMSLLLPIFTLSRAH